MQQPERQKNKERTWLGPEKEFKTPNKNPNKRNLKTIKINYACIYVI